MRDEWSAWHCASSSGNGSRCFHRYGSFIAKRNPLNCPQGTTFFNQHGSRLSQRKLKQCKKKCRALSIDFLVKLMIFSGEDGAILENNMVEVTVRRDPSNNEIKLRPGTT